MEMKEQGTTILFSSHQMEEVEKIAEFADIGDQFDDPVNTYSTGMKARLGFAISVSLPFDIMICDEALSVGDATFSAKCLAKVNELKKDRIFLFVSHTMSTVQRFCERAIVLDKGTMIYSGDATSAIAFYENNILNFGEEPKNKHKRILNPEIQSVPKKVKMSFLEPIIINKKVIESWNSSIHLTEGFVVEWSFRLNDELVLNQHKYRLGMPVYSSEGLMLFSCSNEDLLNGKLLGNSFSGSLTIDRHGLNPGRYQIVMALYEGMEPILRQHIGEIKVASNGIPSFGLYNVDHHWALNR